MSDDEERDPLKGVVVEVPGKGFFLPLEWTRMLPGYDGLRYKIYVGGPSYWTTDPYKVHRPKGVLAIAEGTHHLFLKGEVVLFEWREDLGTVNGCQFVCSTQNCSNHQEKKQYQLLNENTAKHWKIIAVIGGELAERQPEHLPEGPVVLEIPGKGYYLPGRYFPECGAYQYHQFGAPETHICLAFDYRVHAPQELWAETPHVGGGAFRYHWSKENPPAYHCRVRGRLYPWHLQITRVVSIDGPPATLRQGTASPEAQVEPMKAGESVKAEPPLRLVRSAATSTGAWYVVTGFDEGKKVWKGKSYKSATYDFPEGTSRVIEPAEVMIEYNGRHKHGPLLTGSTFRAKVDGDFFRFPIKEGDTNLMNVKAGSRDWKITEAYTAQELKQVEKTNPTMTFKIVQWKEPASVSITNNVDVGETINSSLSGIEQEVLDHFKKDVKRSMYLQLYGGRPSKLVTPGKEDLTKEKFDSIIGKFLEGISPTRRRMKGIDPAYQYQMMVETKPFEGYRFDNYCHFLGLEKSDWPESLISSTPTMRQEKHPMKIETVVQINGQNSSRYTTDELLDFIKKERDRIAELQGMNVNSEKVESMIAEHTANVNRLIAILDGKALPETK